MAKRFELVGMSLVTWAFVVIGGLSWMLWDVATAEAYSDGWQSGGVPNVVCSEVRLVMRGGQRDPIGRPAYPMRIDRDLPAYLENYSDRVVFIAEALTDGELETFTDEERLDAMLVADMLTNSSIAIAIGRRAMMCLNTAFPRSETSAVNGKRRYPVVRFNLLDT